MVPSSDRMSVEDFRLAMIKRCEDVVAASSIDPVARHETLTVFVSTIICEGLTWAQELRWAESALTWRSPSIPTACYSACVKTVGDPLPARP